MNKEQMIKEIEKMLTLIAKGKLKIEKYENEKEIHYDIHDDLNCRLYILEGYETIAIFKTIKGLYENFYENGSDLIGIINNVSNLSTDFTLYVSYIFVSDFWIYVVLYP